MYKFTCIGKLLLISICVLFCNAGYSQWAQQGPLLYGSGANGPAWQGEQAAFSADGKTAIIGAPYNNNKNGGFFVHRLTGGQWVQQGFIEDNTFSGNSGTSFAVSADGNTLAMAGYPFVIKVYVYQQGQWNLQFIRNNGINYSSQTKSISLSYDGNTLLYQNEVWVRSGVNWSFEANLLPLDRTTIAAGQCDTANGFSCTCKSALSADGNTAVVGDVYAPDTTACAWVFTRNGTTWSQQGTRLEGTGKTGYYYYNSSSSVRDYPVAISGDGNTLTIGALIGTISGFTIPVFHRIGSVWVKESSHATGANILSASSVSLSYNGNRLVATINLSYPLICTWQHTTSGWSPTHASATPSFTGPYDYYSGTTNPLVLLDSSGNALVYANRGYRNNMGSAWYFSNTPSGWVQQHELYGTGTHESSAQGSPVTISADGNTLAVGGIADNGNAGAVWIYTRSGFNWTQQGPKMFIADNAWQARRFGSHIALSADGGTMAVAAPGSGSNRNLAVTSGWGNVYVYTRNGNTYIPQGDSISEGSAAQFGSEVALSGDGNTMLITTYDSGAYIYTRNNAVWSRQAYLYAPGTSLGKTGRISADGNTAVICDVTIPGTAKGALYIYVRNGTTWSLQAGPVQPAGLLQGDFFGGIFALSGNGNVIAATKILGNTAWIYRRTGNTWNLADTIASSNSFAFYGGMALSSTGDTLIGSAGSFNSAIQVYVHNGNQWSLSNTFSSPDFAPYQLSGANLAATPDMKWIVQGGHIDASFYASAGGAAVFYNSPIQDNLLLLQHASCPNTPNGKIRVSVLTGTAPFTFTWSNGGANADSAVNLLPGTYTLTISDAGGDSIVRSYVINATDSLTNATYNTSYNCGTNTGTITVQNAGGTGPYSYTWGTTPPQNTGTATGLAAGIYWLTISDASGCTLVDTALLDANVLRASATSVQGTCGGNGLLTATPYGGISPYTVLWSNAGNTFTINAGAGAYAVTVTDATGCTASGTASLSTVCNNEIRGHIFFDRNNNCLHDGAEKPAALYTLTATNGIYTAYGSADNNGDYVISVPTADSFTVGIAAWQGCVLRMCNGSSYPLRAGFASTGGVAAGLNFALADAGIDLAVESASATPNPGFPFTYTIYYGNMRDSVVPATTVTLSYDARLAVNSTTPPYTVLDSFNHTITWNVANIGFLQPLSAAKTVSVEFMLPQSVLPTTLLYMNPCISLIAGDCNTVNNCAKVPLQVLGSLDPNYKQAFPDSTINIGDSILTYTIHFQNTGSDTTHFIELRDTLSADVDPATVRTIAASHHPYKFSISENGILTWRFEPILLPDSATDPVNSQGSVSYTVLTRPSLLLGRVIKNTASIYFDYNEPVQTNTVQNTVVDPVGIPRNYNNGAVRVFPNPFSSYTTIQVLSDVEHYDVLLYNMLGQSMAAYTNITGSTFNLPRNNLATGCYLFKVASGGNTIAYGRLIAE